MFGQGFNYGFLGKPLCFTDTTDIFKDNSGVALYTLDYDGSDSGNATGKFSEAAVFNGSSSKIVTGLTLPADSSMSFSLWFKTSTTGVDQQLFGEADSNFSNLSIRIGLWFMQSNNNIRVWIANGSSQWYTTLAGVSYLDGNWHNFVLSINGTSVKLYADGASTPILDTTSSVAFGTAGVTPLTIGAPGSAWAASYFWTGDIDQVRIFNKEISSSEVTTLYNETKNTTNTLQILGDTSCIATYTFDGSSTDLSGNYSGTDTNILYKYDGTPTNVDFGVGGKSLYSARFNGSSSRIALPKLTGLTADVSVSGWVNLGNTTTSNRIRFIEINTDANGYAGTLSIYYKPSNGEWQARSGNGTSSNSNVLTHTYTLTQSTWYHVCFTRDDSTNVTKFYINGSLQDTETVSVSSSYPSGATGVIGDLNYSAGLNYNWLGEIDQVRIFNKALSSSEVSKLYGNGAGEIACTYTSTTDNIALPITNTAYYKLDNDSKDSARSTGKFNEGAIFNGTSSKITLPSIPGLPSNSNNTNDFTFSCWVRSTTTRLNNGAASNPIFQNYVGSYQFIGFGGNDNANFPTGRLFYYTYGGSGYHNSWITTSNSYADGQWHHVVVTDKYNSGTDNRTRTIYVDGIQRDQDTVDKHFNNQTETNHLIGDSTGSGNRHLGADLDQIRIYDTVLSSTDVSNLYAETASDTNTLSFPSGQTAIATYQLDGNSNDVSGNYSGTDTDIKYAYDGTESNIEYRFGRFGQAAVFNGSSSTIATPAKIPSSLNFSFSFWFNTTSTYASGYIFSTKENSLTNGYYLLANNGLIQYGEGNGSTNATAQYSTTTDLNDGNWHHCVLTRAAGGTVNMYIDNIKEVNNASVGSGYMTSSNWRNNLRIGRYSGVHPSGLYYNGKLDQVRIYDAVLTSDQVTDLYNEKPEVDTSNFKAVLYEGTGSTQYISNVGFQPDLVWIKNRDQATNHMLYDIVRGATKTINTNNAGAEATHTDALTSFESNGFIVGAKNHVNQNGSGIIAWNWKASGDAVAGTGTGVSNVSVSANTDAGFSIVKYTGGNSASDTVGHGLTDAEMIILKDLTDGTNNWRAWHKDLTSGYWLYLNLTNAQASAATDGGIRNVDANTFGFINGTTAGVEGVNSNASDYIAYVWKSVTGHSKISTYEGNGTNDYSKEITGLGFNPSFVMVKNVDSSGSNWEIIDSRRGDVKNLYANESYAENANSPASYGSGKFITDGFEVARGSVSSSVHWNKSGDTYLYMAFK